MANEIQQPRPFDLVGNPILIGGIRLRFEATLQYRIHDDHDERTGHFTVRGGTGEHGQFQLSVGVSGAAFQLDRLFVEVYEESAANGSEINKVIVPVILGRRIVAGYIGFRLHVVRRGDTLSEIARTTMVIQAASAISREQIHWSSVIQTASFPARHSRYLLAFDYRAGSGAGPPTSTRP